jgi:hypothetical protein
MKTIVAFFALILVAFAQDNTARYAGTNNGTVWTPPTLDLGVSPPTCAAAGYQAYGVSFTYNVTVPGVKYVAVMTEGAFEGYVKLFAYQTTFDAANPCTNIVFHDFSRVLGDSGSPPINDFLYMATGTYIFVVTASAADTVGQIAITVAPALANGQTTAASPTWAPASGDTCTTSGSGTPFGWFSWTQAQTGSYDLTVGFWNGTNAYFSYTYLTLYTGNKTAGEINMDSCAGYIRGDYSSGDKAIALWNRTLTQGTTYTVIVSGYNVDEIGYWGFWTQASTVRSLIASPTWTQPERGTTPCTASSNTASWERYTFTAVGNVAIVDTASLPSNQGFTYVDTYSWLFRGNGADVPSNSCPGEIITAGDTGDVTPVYGVTLIGRNYTVVISTYSGSTNVGDCALYAFSGTPIGYIDVPVPTDETTSAEDAENAEGDDAEDDSSAAGVFVSFALIAILALLF